MMSVSRCNMPDDRRARDKNKDRPLLTICNHRLAAPFSPVRRIPSGQSDHPSTPLRRRTGSHASISVGCVDPDLRACEFIDIEVCRVTVSVTGSDVSNFARREMQFSSALELDKLETKLRIDFFTGSKARPHASFRTISDGCVDPELRRDDGFTVDT
jgi:hypothetical protein